MRPAAGAATTTRRQAGKVLALAYPDRVAKARGGTGAFVMANGRGAMVEPHDALAREPYLAIAEIAGGAVSARILLAAPLALADIEDEFAGHIVARDELSFDRDAAALRARRTRRLGALVLAEQTLPVPSGAEAARKLAEGIASLGIGRLPWTKPLEQWRARVQFLRRARRRLSRPLRRSAGCDRRATGSLPSSRAAPVLRQSPPTTSAARSAALLPWDLSRRLDAECPTHFDAPTGNRHAIDYEAEGGPVLAIRVQELFGLKDHPSVAGGRLPLGAASAVARAPADPDHPGSSGLLARVVGGREGGNEGTLSAPPLAGRPRRRRTDRAGQAAGDIKSLFLSCECRYNVRVFLHNELRP